MSQLLPPTINANLSPDPGGGNGEYRFSPYLTLGGPNMFGIEVPDLANPGQVEAVLNVEPVKRFTLSVSPLQEVYPYYPNDGGDKWLVNLDTEHLYTAIGEYESYGAGWIPPAVHSYTKCYDKYKSNDGAYDIPVPVQGLPIEFRKVYFRGSPVDQYGKIIGCSGGSGSSGVNAYYAYFACSKPIFQPCTGDEYDENGGSGCAYNSRNENFGIMEGEVSAWESFDIGGGGGGGGGVGGCPDVYSMMSGHSWTNEETGVFASGCGGQSGSGVISSTVTFLATGTATGHGSGNFKFALRSHQYTQESGPQFLVHMDGLGHVFTGFKSTHSGEYKAADRSDHFNFRGVSGIKTLIEGRNLHIGGPNFRASGCLEVETETSTNTVAYSIDKSGVLNCLGYEERTIGYLACNSGVDGEGSEGPIAIPFPYTGTDPPYDPTGNRQLINNIGEATQALTSGLAKISVCFKKFLVGCPDGSWDPESNGFGFVPYLDSGCCSPLIGACCMGDGTCSETTEEDCLYGVWHGAGTNCYEAAGPGGPPYYDYTYNDLCEEGIGCVYVNEYKEPPHDDQIIGYVCYDGEFGDNQITRLEYLQHIYSDVKYHADEEGTFVNPSMFKVGETCVSNSCPTTTSTTTSTSTTSTTTTSI